VKKVVVSTCVADVTDATTVVTAVMNSTAVIRQHLLTYLYLLFSDTVKYFSRLLKCCTGIAIYDLDFL